MIRPLTDKDFEALLTLNAMMYREIDESINYFQATNTLITLINGMTNFTAIGLFNANGLLIGFTSGYEINKKCFHFSGIYVMMKINKSLKSLIDFSFAFIKDKGYETWTVDATNTNIQSILCNKYNANEKFTRLLGVL